eukprot:3505489-Pleurochrysis_carterae.AAC.1
MSTRAACDGTDAPRPSPNSYAPPRFASATAAALRPSLLPALVTSPGWRTRVCRPYEPPSPRLDLSLKPPSPQPIG